MEENGWYCRPIQERDSCKILCYFPPIPRFKRMFQSSKTDRGLIWHANERMVDGKLEHLADLKIDESRKNVTSGVFYF